MSTSDKISLDEIETLPPPDDMNDDEKVRIWEEQLDQAADRRVKASVRDLVDRGIVRADGSLISDELPDDMRPDSKTSVDTG